VPRLQSKKRGLLGLQSTIVSFSLGPVEMPPKQTTAKTAVHDDAPLNQTSEPTPLNQTSEPMMAISSRQDYLALAAAYIHQEDDVEQAHDWIERGGRVNASRLAKKLPHTARGLADGSTDPDALANNLINGLVERTVAQSLINADGTVRLLASVGGGTISDCVKKCADLPRSSQSSGITKPLYSRKSVLYSRKSVL
jgi:hypothetical protein